MISEHKLIMITHTRCNFIFFESKVLTDFLLAISGNRSTESHSESPLCPSTAAVANFAVFCFEITRKDPTPFEWRGGRKHPVHPMTKHNRLW